MKVSLGVLVKKHYTFTEASPHTKTNAGVIYLDEQRPMTASVSSVCEICDLAQSPSIWLYRVAKAKNYGRVAKSL